MSPRLSRISVPLLLMAASVSAALLVGAPEDSRVARSVASAPDKDSKERDCPSGMIELETSRGRLCLAGAALGGRGADFGHFPPGRVVRDASRGNRFVRVDSVILHDNEPVTLCNRTDRMIVHDRYRSDEEIFRDRRLSTWNLLLAPGQCLVPKMIPPNRIWPSITYSPVLTARRPTLSRARMEAIESRCREARGILLRHRAAALCLGPRAGAEVMDLETLSGTVASGGFVRDLVTGALHRYPEPFHPSESAEVCNFRNSVIVHGTDSRIRAGTCALAGSLPRVFWLDPRRSPWADPTTQSGR